MGDVAVSYNERWWTFTGSQIPQDPDAEFTVLLVTSGGTLSAGNTILRDLLQTRHQVVVRSWDDDESYDGIDVVVLSAGNPPGDSGRFLYPPVGIVAVDSWRRVGMGTTLGYETDVVDVEALDTSSPILAGATGTFEPYQAPALMTWEENPAGAQLIGRRPNEPTRTVLFAYEAGSTMPTRFASTRHVALGYHVEALEEGALTPVGRAQVLAAVDWAAATAVVGLGVPTVPSGVWASAGDSRVTVGWQAPQWATSYTVSRSTTSGGPYTVLDTLLTGTSYPDTTVTNDTTYYYVVSAQNSEGSSPDSLEVSGTPQASDASNLALLATSAEKTLWQDRKINGPFKTTGDFSTYSPGHWDEMVTNMAVDRSTLRWSGPPNLINGRVPRNPELPGKDDVPNSPTGDAFRNAADMVGAAYAAMTNENNTVAADIVDEIEWHAQQTALDYGDRTLWPYDYYQDIGPLFKHALWVRDFVIAYDVCKGMGQATAGQQTTIEGWFSDLAYLCENSSGGDMDRVFPNRRSNSYTSRASWVNDRVFSDLRLADGTRKYYPRIMLFYNNRRVDIAALSGLVGVLVDDSYLIDEYKRFMREWVMFANSIEGSSTGHWGDVNRGSSTFPQKGLSYGLQSQPNLLWAAEALARQGDTSVYDFGSSEGANIPGIGTNHYKTFEDCIDTYMQWIGRLYPPHYSDACTAGSSTCRIQTRDPDGEDIVADGPLLLPANYFGRTDWYDIINRVDIGFTAAIRNVGALTGWRLDRRQRFLRSIDANPYGGA